MHLGHLQPNASTSTLFSGIRKLNVRNFLDSQETRSQLAAKSFSNACCPSILLLPCERLRSNNTCLVTGNNEAGLVPLPSHVPLLHSLLHSLHHAVWVGKLVWLSSNVLHRHATDALCLRDGALLVREKKGLQAHNLLAKLRNSGSERIILC